MHTRANQLSRVGPAAVRGAFVTLAVTACASLAAAQTTTAPQTTPTPQTAALQTTADKPPKPTGTVETGGGGVTQGSFKAGEYNGSEDKGGYFIGQLDLRSGATYISDSALRWRVKGTDLGLASRNLSAQYGVQGKFWLKFSYDELLRNRSDTYQTPYLGTGTNTLTLPGTWLVPNVAGSNNTNPASARGLVKAIGDAPYISTVAANNGAIVAPTAAQMALVDAAAAADLPLFHNVNLSTTRTRYEAGLNYLFDPRWAFDFTFRPEHKDGLKPMGTVSRNTGADISTVIPDLIDSNTNQLGTSLAFKGKKSFAQAAYYGSFYTNAVTSISWQNWAAAPGVANANTISSPPSNTFNQFNATAGVTFKPTTKLVVSGSYGRATQNDPFITDASTPVVPEASLNGLVVSTAFTARFTTKPAKKLNLTATYKYDNRDNHTPVALFQFADANQPLPTTPNADFPAGPNNPLGAIIAQNANANRPYSRQANLFNAEADYAVGKGNWIKGGYDFERVGRSCPGSWIDCADAATTNENTMRVEWRAHAGSTLTTRISYAYSLRRTPNYNEDAFLALVPYANVSPASATGGATALSFMRANGWNGWGPALGFGVTTGSMNLFFPSNNALANSMYGNTLNRISELPGLRRYYVADRNRDKIRALLTWDASARLSFQGGADFNHDDYPGSVYGLQNAKSWAAFVDGTYALTKVVSANAFYTYDNSNLISAGNTYTANNNTSALTNSQAGAIFLADNACDGYVTLQQRNNNNKLDPCLDWSSNRIDKVHTVGVGLRARTDRMDFNASLIGSSARGDNTVLGGSWSNNILNGPGGPPTTIAAYFIPAASLPTVVTDSVEVRLNSRFTITKTQSLRVSYAYLHMNNADWMYEGVQTGSLSTQLPTSEQPFRYKVNTIGVSYLITF